MTQGNDFNEWWPRFCSGDRRGGLMPSKDEVLQQIDDNKAVFLRTDSSAFVLQFSDDSMHVWLYAGDMGSLPKDLLIAEQIALKSGKVKITIDGRLGWQKVLKGWDVVSVRMERVL